MTTDFENFWPRQRVLITGGAGFLGAWLTKLLHDEGVPVGRVAWADLRESYACLDALDETETRKSRRPVFLGLNVTIEEKACCVIQAYAPTVIFHMAGQSHINAAQASALSAMWVNVVGTLNILSAVEAIKSLYPVRVVVASSNHVYGPVNHDPMDEDTPLRQLDIYGASKACVDIMTRSLALATHRPYVALRNVNAYGPADPHASHLVTGTIKSLLAGEATTLRGDGSAAKQYLHAEDVARAYLVAAKLADNRSIRGRAFNIAPPTAPVSARQMVEMLREIADLCELSSRERPGPGSKPVEITGGPEQRGYYEHLDAGEFVKYTGWRPRWSLTEGLADTLAWYRHHGYQWIPSA